MELSHLYPFFWLSILQQDHLEHMDGGTHMSLEILDFMEGSHWVWLGAISCDNGDPYFLLEEGTQIFGDRKSVV